MEKKNKQEQNIVEVLYHNLEKYLLLMGVEIQNDFFCCIHPDHDDKNPSCSIGGKGDRNLFHCFSCDKGSGNIFHAAHFLEGLPLYGPEFFNITVASLAKKLGIEYTPTEISESEKDRITLRRAVSDASTIVNNFVLDNWDTDLPYVQMIKDRKLSKKTVKEWSIGAIPSIVEYKQKMLNKGWDETYLVTNQLLPINDIETPTTIFAPDKIIITIKDYHGRPIAFVSRKNNWNKDGDIPKYVNSTNSSIYEKSNTFFGMDLAKKSVRKQPLYIVEGYIDAITLRQEGFENVVALGSAGFCEELLSVFDELKERKVNINHIVLCFDGDDAGTQCTRNAIDIISKKRSDLIIEIKQLPKTVGYHDPDEIIKKAGIKSFKEIEVLSSFKWDLNYRRVDSEEPEDVFVKRVCNQISTVDSPIDRRSKARDLADVLKLSNSMFTIEDIINEVEEMRGKTNSKMNKELEVIFDNMLRKRNTCKGEELVEVLAKSYSDVKIKQREYNQRYGNLDEIYQTQAVKTRKEFESTRPLNGFKLNKFRRLEQMLDGFPDSECLVALAGDSNIGKCLNPLTTITYSDGSIDTIKNIVDNKINKSVLCFDKNNNAVEGKIKNWFKCGIKQSYKTIFENGYYIESSDEHKFLTETKEYKQLKELKIGSYVAIPKKLTCGKLYSYEKSKILGYIIGDGGITKGSLGFTNNDNIFINDLENLLKSINKDLFLSKNKAKYQYHFCDKSSTSRTPNYIKVLLEELNVYGCDSYTKFIPDVIKYGSEQDAIGFLEGYIATDGCFHLSKDSNQYCFEITSASEQLMKDTQYLFHKLGIITKISIKRIQSGKYKGNIYYRISINNYNNLLIMSEKLNIGSLKDIKTLTLKETKHGGNNKDRIPLNFIHELKNIITQNKLTYKLFETNLNLTSKSFHNLFTTTGLLRNKSIGRIYANKILNVIKSYDSKIDVSSLEWYLSNDIQWVAISDIIKCDMVEMYDIEVETYHNFVANGIITHNSSWIREISWDIAKSNKDAIVVYMSIDDSTKDVLLALVANEAELSRKVVYKYGTYNIIDDSDKVQIAEAIDNAWDRVLKQDNYIIADSTQGSSYLHLEDHIAFIRRTYLDKKPIIFLDNFHKLKFSDNSSIREKFIDLSQNLKELTVIENLPICMSVELRKTENGKRPNLSDIAETKQIEYDSKIVLIAYQEMHYNDKTNVYWQRDTYGDECINLPYLELQIAKNKHSEHKCWIGYRFEPDRSILTEVDYELEIRPKREQKFGSNNS